MWDIVVKTKCSILHIEKVTEISLGERSREEKYDFNGDIMRHVLLKLHFFYFGIVKFAPCT